MENKWDKISCIRKRDIESGKDVTFSKLFLPYYEKSFSLLAHKTLLEIGGGTGHLAKHLNNCLRPTLHTVCDSSINMAEIMHETLAKVNVDVYCLDFLVYKSITKYDLIYSHMVFHTLKKIDIFFSKVRTLLEENGNFIFSIPHPCFYNDYKKIFNTDYLYTKEQETSFQLKISNSDEYTSPIPYYHRPLAFYINTVIKYFDLKKFDEVFPSPEIMKLYKNEFFTPNYIVFYCQQRLAQ